MKSSENTTRLTLKRAGAEFDDPIKSKLSTIAEIAAYSFNYADPTDNPSFTDGVVESTCHMISCCLVQWLPEFYGDGIGCGDILSILNGARTKDGIYQQLVKLTLDES